MVEATNSPQTVDKLEVEGIAQEGQREGQGEA